MEENLWLLFEMKAFNKHDELENHDDFIEIGKNIVGKCHRNPLAIKVIGSLLYGQNISNWRSIENSRLAEISGNDKILPILKLSYHNLTPSLKSCFSYCAIFPKDSEMDKEMLIGVWRAQGYIVSLDGSQSLDNVAEEYFMNLMRRCFFQDIMKDEWGNVMYVKIHDLMHDVAQEVRKEEICVMTSTKSILGEKVRHVNIDSKIRSYICSNNNDHLLGNQLEKSRTLRVLDTPYFGIKSLSHSMGRFYLLRYLKLWDHNLEVLSDSITKLYNLETFILDCMKLRELPKDLSKLVKLSHLDVQRCHKLICTQSQRVKFGIHIIPWPELSLSHNLVYIEIYECHSLVQIPVLSKLPNLKALKLSSIDSVEYMENEMSNNINNTKTVAEFFRSFETLVISYLPKLKG